MNLRVGERVRVIVDSPEFGWGSIQENSIGVIVEVNSDHINVNFPEQDYWKCRERELQPVDRDVPKRTRYYKDMTGNIDLKPVSEIFNKEVKKCCK